MASKPIFVDDDVVLQTGSDVSILLCLAKYRCRSRFVGKKYLFSNNVHCMYVPWLMFMDLIIVYCKLE